MGKPKGFMEYERTVADKIPPQERIANYREFSRSLPEQELKRQAARCMNCGVPFCHIGCPLGNLMPDWNDCVYRGDWEEAVRRLLATNNFPEFTGRLCPAPCEESCCLGINEPAVTIEQIEKEIIERAFSKGWIRPEPPPLRTGKRVAVIGSGPSGLACAQQLNRAGHLVSVFERADKVGGILRYGIPDFKMEKSVIDRRISIMEQEGINFFVNSDVGGKSEAEKILRDFDAVVLAIGSTRPRDLNIPGRNLKGIHFAMEFLCQQNRINSGAKEDNCISAKDKNVIVIGGGDTGSDCVGTSIRQGARSVVNFELFPQPPKDRPAHQPWPYYPNKLRMSTSHEEGGQRFFSISTKEFVGENGNLRSVRTMDVKVSLGENGSPAFEEIPGSFREWPADLAFLALGFVGPEKEGILAQLGCELDNRGNIRTDGKYSTNVAKVFAAGDSRKGQSLIVWAISEGRECAYAVDKFLTGRSFLPKKGGYELPRV